MKNVLWVSGFLLSSALTVAHAAPSPSSSTLTSASEILNLPAENRRMVLVGKADKLYPSFIEIAFNENQPMGTRWRALMTAAEAKKEKATADILKAGEHKTWYMRNAALVALSQVNPFEAQKLAKKLIKDKALVVRSAAVGVFSGSLTSESRELLWSELNEKYNFKGAQSLWIRRQIVEVLAQRPSDNELKTFASLLSDKDERVQVQAVRGLQKLTGVKLGEGKMAQTKLVSMWKDYLKKDGTL